tara:strand:+ start:424 stop:573 length:150 start_codon:yes stop_codon:yes gene_type:complete
MEVGDLVRDKHAGDLGIIIDDDPDDGTYKVMFHDGVEWLSDAFLEVING